MRRSDSLSLFKNEVVSGFFCEKGALVDGASGDLIGDPEVAGGSAV